MVDQLESRCAVTLKANDLILANVRAAAIVHKALVKICSKDTDVTFTSVPLPMKWHKYDLLSGDATLKSKDNM